MISFLALPGLRLYTVVMAKINRASRQNIWQVEISVDDPDCKWNINPTSKYFKIVKANNENAAMRGAANHCTKQMQAFPGVHFSYSTKNIKPYYPLILTQYQDIDNQLTTTKY